jgi:hypothetical protein
VVRQPSGLKETKWRPQGGSRFPARFWRSRNSGEGGGAGWRWWASSTAADRPAVALAGLASHGWTTYFTGPLPPEGWIPVGVVITPEGETKVRIRVCRNDGTALLADESAFGRGRSAGLCREQTLDLMAGR